MIEVRRSGSDDPMEFEVTVSDARSQSRHTVTMSQQSFEQLSAGKASPEQCVHAAFEFLLEREPKESILSRFDVTVIGRYFPSFEKEFSRYLPD